VGHAAEKADVVCAGVAGVLGEIGLLIPVHDRDGGTKGIDVVET
jgi:hypothetical protein